MTAIPVKVEFLYDHSDLPANEVVALPGCEKLTAANLRGTGFVARDWTEEELKGNVDGKGVTVKAKYAGLEGYLIAKAYSTRERGLDRDYYDLVFVLLYNRAGGPGRRPSFCAAASSARRSEQPAPLFREVAGRFADASGFAAESYASQALGVEPDADRAQLRQDALSAISEFITALQLKP